MPLFRKKPIVIEAYKLPTEGEEATQELIDFLHDMPDKWGQSDRDGSIVIETLEGDMLAAPGDWIIKGVNGEYYPCKPDIFEKTYERA